MDHFSYKIYVIIVTYNGEKWIKLCLDSLLKTKLDLTIIVIDNASTDNTTSVLNQYSDNINFYELKKNIGFGQANNIGLKEAEKNNADFVLLLNQDAFISDNMIECLIDKFEAYPEYGILSPVHFQYDGENLDLAFTGYCPRDFLNDLFFKKVRDVYKTEMVNAAIWLIKGEVVKRLGGFDKLFFHGGEDNDFARRLQYNNLSIGIVPKAHAYHSHETFGKKENFTFTDKCRNQCNWAILNLIDTNINFIYAFGEYLINFCISIVFGVLTLKLENVKLKFIVTTKVFFKFFGIIEHRKRIVGKIATPIEIDKDVINRLCSKNSA